ncbi:hypothetical protein ALC57_00978 [Trachymyrmex cornetzi]|uniref:Uncharacterized protein n=1 Tax=Trachymyrmex cornetzi TaxID=471704 RepID=A0A195EN63_9HYME|nr:hypothetical protein ALC57_00978 [Trachymyrmex cornetzi]
MERRAKKEAAGDDGNSRYALEDADGGKKESRGRGTKRDEMPGKCVANRRTETPFNVAGNPVNVILHRDACICMRVRVRACVRTCVRVCVCMCGHSPQELRRAPRNRSIVVSPLGHYVKRSEEAAKRQGGKLVFDKKRYKVRITRDKNAILSLHEDVSIRQLLCKFFKNPFPCSDNCDDICMCVYVEMFTVLQLFCATSIRLVSQLCTTVLKI